MVKQMEEETGEEVKYVVLPTFGYEHKVGGWGGPGRLLGAVHARALMAACCTRTAGYPCG